MDFKALLFAGLIWLGIVANPSALLAGCVWAIMIYGITIALLRRTGFWGIIAGIGLSVFLALLISVIYPAIPFLMNMPVIGAMAFGGALSACVCPKIISPPKFMTDVLTALLKWKSS